MNNILYFHQGLGHFVKINIPRCKNLHQQWCWGSKWNTAICQSKNPWPSLALVECFLPDAYLNYVLSNEVSEWYRKYKDNILSFLHGQSHAIVLQCLDRHSRKRKYDEVVIAMLKEGCFESNRGTHNVDFGVTTTSPLCTCKDWIHWHIPCKHFFLTRTWDSLPEANLKQLISISWQGCHQHFLRGGRRWLYTQQQGYVWRQPPWSWHSIRPLWWHTWRS